MARHTFASVLSHVSLGTNDYPRAKAFYDAVPGHPADPLRDGFSLAVRAMAGPSPSSGSSRRSTAVSANAGNGVHVASWPTRSTK